MTGHKRILIVGGVAGGASCAARARRLSEDAQIIIFEKGPYVSFANCFPAFARDEPLQKESSLDNKMEIFNEERPYDKNSFR